MANAKINIHWIHPWSADISLSILGSSISGNSKFTLIQNLNVFILDFNDKHTFQFCEAFLLTVYGGVQSLHFRYQLVDQSKCRKIFWTSSKRFSDFVFKIRLIRLGFSFKKLKSPVMYLNSQPTNSQSGVIIITPTETAVRGRHTFSHAWLILVEFY